MKTETEIQEILGESELAYVSAEYFSQVGNRIGTEGLVFYYVDRAASVPEWVASL